jgi:hypothetical protein
MRPYDDPANFQAETVAPFDLVDPGTAPNGKPDAPTRELRCEGWAEKSDHAKGKDCDVRRQFVGESVLHFFCPRHRRQAPADAIDVGGCRLLSRPYELELLDGVA